MLYWKYHTYTKGETLEYMSYENRIKHLTRLEDAGISFTFGELERMSDDELIEWIIILDDENKT